jgi:hypothetical protein
MFLVSTSAAIEALLSASAVSAVTLDTSYYDDPVASGTPLGGTKTTVSGTTPVTIVAAPSAGIGRAIHFILAHNPNVLAVELTIRRVGGGNLWKGTLQASETFHWNFRGEPSQLSTPSHTHQGLLPAGGTTGQVPKKASGTDFDYGWEDNTLGVVYGEQELDVGSTRVFDKTFTISSATCTAAKKLQAYITPKATTEHSLDEHIVDPPLVYAHSPASGSFSITLASRDRSPLYGRYNIGWLHT